VSRAVHVSVEWALYDSTPGQERGPLLGYSAGRLGRDNFVDAISRVQLGAAPEPAQVVVGSLKERKRPDGGYLSLAIHEYAPDQEPGQSGPRTEHTRYFCAGYRSLADAGIGYQAMYRALRGVRLRPVVGPPLRVSIEAAELLSPAVEPPAAEVAALLLTGRPVCVLGARGAGVSARLAFIDTVMALLPYGLRSAMSATTWINPVKEQAFKLFFSSERRPRHPEDHVVTWGEAHKEDIPADRPGHPRAGGADPRAAHRPGAVDRRPGGPGEDHRVGRGMNRVVTVTRITGGPATLAG
jgi:hypothetical protein